jgi:outer membrane protein assembly factor BamB
MPFTFLRIPHKFTHRLALPCTRLLFLALVCAYASASMQIVRADAAPLWTHAATAGSIKWYTLTDAGTLLIGTETSVYSLNPDNGQVAWRRDDLKGIAEHETQEIFGTPSC